MDWRKVSVAFVLLLLVLVASNALWFLAALDQGVTRTHREDQQALERSSARLLADLIVAAHLPLTREGVVNAAVSLPDAGERLVAQEGDTLFVDEVGFVLDGERVVGIDFMWEPGTAPSPRAVGD